MKRNNICDIEYVNSKNETSQRTIIPTTVPYDTYKAIDVTELSKNEQQEIQQLLEEYQEYAENYKANMFNFETWVNHAKGTEISPKWRTFKKDRIKE